MEAIATKAHEGRPELTIRALHVALGRSSWREFTRPSWRTDHVREWVFSPMTYCRGQNAPRHSDCRTRPTYFQVERDDPWAFDSITRGYSGWPLLGARAMPIQSTRCCPRCCVFGSGHRSDHCAHGKSTEEEPLRLNVEVEVLQTSCLSDHAFPKASTSQWFTAWEVSTRSGFSVQFSPRRLTRLC